MAAVGNPELPASHAAAARPLQNCVHKIWPANETRRLPGLPCERTTDFTAHIFVRSVQTRNHQPRGPRAARREQVPVHLHRYQRFSLVGNSDTGPTRRTKCAARRSVPLACGFPLVSVLKNPTGMVDTRERGLWGARLYRTFPQACNVLGWLRPIHRTEQPDILLALLFLSRRQLAGPPKGLLGISFIGVQLCPFLVSWRQQRPGRLDHTLDNSAHCPSSLHHSSPAYDCRRL